MRRITAIGILTLLSASILWGCSSAGRDISDGKNGSSYDFPQELAEIPEGYFTPAEKQGTVL